MELEVMNDDMVEDIMEKIINFINDDYLCGFLLGYAEASKNRNTFSEVIKNFTGIEDTLRTELLSLIAPLYEKYDVEKSLLGSY